MNVLQNTGTALITGASSGIGAVYADRLAKRGHDLIVVARDEQRLKLLADRLTAATGRKVETVKADLSNPADLKAVEERLRGDTTISTFVNNAGVGAVTPLIQSDVDQLNAMIHLNVTVATRLAHAAASAFAGRRIGTIINISSVLALAPENLNGVYAGTKAFILTLSQSMHHELAPAGLRIQAVLPGATRSEFWDRAGLPIDNLPTEILMSANDMVDAALAGLDAGEVVTIPALAKTAGWETLEAARRSLGPHLSAQYPADRYTKGQSV